MKNKYITFAVVFLFALTTQAQIFGILEIPKVIKNSDPNGPPGSVVNKDAKVKIYSKPNKNDKILIEASADDLDAVEFRYEEMGFLVYAMVTPLVGDWKWYQIKTKKGKGWVYSEDAGPLHDLGEHYHQAATYLNKNWDQKFYKKPQIIKSSSTETKDEGSYNVAVKDIMVLKSENLSGMLWLQVQEVKGRCEGEETFGKKMWVPAFNTQSQMNVWFYPRGC